MIGLGIKGEIIDATKALGGLDGMLARADDLEGLGKSKIGADMSPDDFAAGLLVEARADAPQADDDGLQERRHTALIDLSEVHGATKRPDSPARLSA